MFISLVFVLYDMVTWNLSHILVQPLDKVKRDLFFNVEKIESFKPLKASLSPSAFQSLVLRLEKTYGSMSRLAAFSQLQLSINTADPIYNAFAKQIEQLSAEIANRLLFVDVWWKRLPKKQALRLLSSLKKDRYYWESLRRFAPHTLSEPEEKIITIKDVTGANSLANLYDVITNKFSFPIRIDGKSKTVTQEELLTLVRSPVSQVRKMAYTALLTRYQEHRAELSELYRSLVLDWNNEGRLRQYSSPLSIRNLRNDIPDDAVDALLSACQKNAGLFKQYFKKKMKICGITRPSRFDVYAPFTASSTKYSFNQAKELVLDTFADFSPRMHAHAQMLFEQQHVHSDIVRGKRSGAFCYSATPDLVPYVLLNFTGTAYDVSTLAHETGHAVHSLLAQHHSVFTFHAPLPLAETASIFSEMLLTHKLLKGADARTKRSLLLRELDHIYASVGRQAFFVLFERKAHDLISNGATSDDLDAAWMEGLREQFAHAVSISPLFKNEWLYIPHIFHTPFYCYAYAFGNLLVLALYRLYQQEGERAVSKIEKILSYGGSKKPGEILEEVGIDISSLEFWQSGFDVIKELIDEL
ncbi:oligoendopeptidase F [Candidatus Woesearchaeota archaeon]|nr:oligoendopeptidase F [Candidatus Woesearchaeota archaeon]